MDAKADCAGYYTDKTIHVSTALPLSGTTWDYTLELQDGIYELARIYCEGKTLTTVCPPLLQERWNAIKNRLRSCLKAFKTSDLSLDENCFYDVVPEYFLFEYLETKNQITQHVVDTYRRPPNYTLIYNLMEMLSHIRSRPLRIDIAPINHLLHSTRGQNFHRTLQTVQHVCNYNPWGTITGRLATQPNSFPILTMNKEFRACVRPQNDWLLELDFNAAELRMLLALAGAQQPKNDIHDWNVKNIFNGALTREEAKTTTFAWLYSQRSNESLERLYNKSLVQNKYWDGFKINTDYGRLIEDVDDHHALNYIVQSTTIDMVHEQAYKVYELLKGRKSYISFLIHDAVYIDLAEEDRYEILKLLDTFKQTRYGVFKVNVSAGKNLGEMKELRL